MRICAKFPRGQSGLTLVETTISLSILAFVVIGALSLYESASLIQSTTQLKSNLSTLRATIRQLGMGRGTYQSPNMFGGDHNMVTALMRANRIPETMISDILDDGRNVLIDSGSRNINLFIYGNEPHLFHMQLLNINQTQCINTLAGVVGWNSVNVAMGNDYWTLNWNSLGNGMGVTIPVTVDEATNRCSVAALYAIEFISD
jgi:type II secretory pathway pseudopilin PulG